MITVTSLNLSLSLMLKVGQVKEMKGMFHHATTFNQSLDCWDVSNVTNMKDMFSDAIEFNQPLNTWNTSQVVDMTRMFHNTTTFNQRLDEWDVGKVVSMEGMFDGSCIFNQPLNTWNVSSVTNMNSMFSHTYNFDQPLNDWNVSNVLYFHRMFYKAYQFNQILDKWMIVKQAIDMGEMFYYAIRYDYDKSGLQIRGSFDRDSIFHTTTCPYGTPSRPRSEWRGSLPSYSAKDLSYEYDVDGSWSIPRRVHRFS
jgi:hypothetical protein